MLNQLDYEHIKKNRLYSNILVLGIALFVTGIVILTTRLTNTSMGLTIILSIISLIGVWISYKNAPNVIIKSTGARPVNPNNLKEREAEELVRNLCVGVGLEAEQVPEVYILDSDQINAFATGLTPNDGIICFTTGILNRLNRNEVEAVAGHELSHILHYDMRLTAIIAGMLGIISILAQFFMPKNEEGDSGKGTLIAIAILILNAVIAPIIITLIQMAVSRKREFMADAGSVQITKNPEAMKSALLKISSDSSKMHNVTKEVSAMFIEEPEIEERKNRDAGKSGWFSTHPSIEERIKAIDELI